MSESERVFWVVVAVPATDLAARGGASQSRRKTMETRRLLHDNRSVVVLLKRFCVPGQSRMAQSPPPGVCDS